MIDIEIMQDASEIIHYDSNKLPYAIQERLLSQFTGHKALCHWHPDIECIRIYEGSMNYEINGEQILLRAGDIIIVNSGQLHYGYANGEEDCKFCVELLHPNIFKSNLHIYQESVYPIVHSSSISYWLFHWSDADNFDQLSVCRNQCCLSGHLSGIGWWHGIACYFAFETAYYYPAAGWNFFHVCQKWSRRSFTDLVGISDHGNSFMFCRICIFKENQKK